MKDNDVFALDNSDICFETNINRLGGSTDHEHLFVDVYRRGNGKSKFLCTFLGQHAVTQAVTYIAMLTGEPVAHRVKRQPSSEIWL